MAKEKMKTKIKDHMSKSLKDRVADFDDTTIASSMLAEELSILKEQQKKAQPIKIEVARDVAIFEIENNPSAVISRKKKQLIEDHNNMVTAAGYPELMIEVTV